MKIINSPFQGCYLLKEKVIADKRGHFSETFNYNFLKEKINSDYFVQENESFSNKKVIRGMHYQLPPHAHGKLIQCIKGEIYDVFIDIRCNSETFGQWAGIKLNDENFKQVWLPKGFAHGFLTISKFAKILYKITSHYNPNSERTIRWDDPKIKIEWPKLGMNYLLSEKDSNSNLFDYENLMNINF